MAEQVGARVCLKATPQLKWYTGHCTYGVLMSGNVLDGWAATLFSDAMGTDDQQTPVRWVRNLPLPFALSLDSVLESMLASAMWARLGSW